jgi:hypothetical protein
VLRGIQMLGGVEMLGRVVLRGIQMLGGVDVLCRIVLRRIGSPRVDMLRGIDRVDATVARVDQRGALAGDARRGAQVIAAAQLARCAVALRFARHGAVTQIRRVTATREHGDQDAAS